MEPIFIACEFLIIVWEIQINIIILGGPLVSLYRKLTDLALVGQGLFNEVLVHVFSN